MKPLTICRVTHALYPDVIGGHAIYCHELSARQSHLGHDVEVLTARRDSLPKRELTRNGYRITRFEKVWMPWDSLGMSNPLTPAVYRTVRESKCELVDAHSHLFWTTVLSVRAAIDSGKPVVTTVHGLFAMRDWLTNTSQRMYLWSAGSWALRNSSRVVCLTNSDAVEVHKLGVHASKIRIIPIAVDPTFFRPRPYKRRGIVWIGRIVPEKGLDSLLQAVVEVRKRMDVHVVIVGDGPLRGKLIQLANRMGISDAVTFVRRASRLDVAKLLAQSLIFVLPSKHEGLPLALLEAMAAGNAIVASELPSVKEALGEAGLYYSGNDPKELAENILLALGDRKMCNRYGREARNIVRNEFSWNIVLPRLDGLYEEVVSCS